MGSRTVTFQPAEAAANDTVIYSENPTTNYGTATNITIGSNIPIATTYYYNSLIKFDISSIPSNATVTSAIMYLYIKTDNASSAHTVYAYRLLRNWVETEATWNVYSTGNSWATVGGAYNSLDADYEVSSCSFTATQSDGDEKAFTLTNSYVQSWVNGSVANYGLILFESSGAGDYWLVHSSGSTTAAYYPKLVIAYTTPSNVVWV